MKKDQEIDYYDNIVYKDGNYLANNFDLEGFNLSFPEGKSR